MYNANIVYMSDSLIMVEDYGNDRFYITQVFNNYSLGLQNTKMKIINTMWDGLTNDDVEQGIKEVLHNEGYDIELEIEEYRNSDLYRQLKENEVE
jgi:hypothetical protein